MASRHRFPLFLWAGILATLGQYAVLVAAVELLRWPIVPASTLGSSVGAVINFWLNRRYTFQSDSPVWSSLGRFLLVVAAAIALNGLLMLLFTGYFHWPYLFAQVITTLVVLVFNYLAHARWTFAATKQEKQR